MGGPIAGVSVADDLVTFSFLPLTETGDYRLEFGPHIQDLAGNELDQDQDGIAGEGGNVNDDIVTDVFHLTADTTPPRVVEIPSVALNELSSVRVLVDEPLDVATLVPAQMALITPSGVLDHTQITVTPVVTTVLPGGIELVSGFDVGFPTQTEVGIYTLAVGSGGPTISDLSGNRLDTNGDGNGGQFDDVLAVNIELRSLTSIAGTIGEDTTLSGTVHVTSDLTVASGVTLTIEPGTVLKIAPRSHFNVDGSLLARGTSQHPIIFTSYRDDVTGGDITGPGLEFPSRGDWEALYLDSHDAGVTLENVEIRYAGDFNFTTGGGSVTAVVLGKAGVSLTDVVVLESKATAIRIVGSPSLSGVVVDGAGGDAFSASIAADPSLNSLSAVRFSGLAYALDGGGIVADRVWDFGGMPVTTVSDITVASGATLTIVPGQVVKVNPGSFINIDGSLNAVGTADEPIIFTSVRDDSAGGDTNGDQTQTTPARGDWESLYLDSHDAGVTLVHVEIRYAGDANFTFGGGTVTAVHLAKADTTLRDVLVFESKSTAIQIHGGSPSLTRVHVDGSGFDAFSAAIAASPTYVDLSAARFTRFEFALAGGTISADRVWDIGGLVLHTTGDVTVASGARLTIVPGQVVKMFNASFLDIDGSIVAVGTAQLPIIFTSQSDDSVGGDSNGNGNATSPARGDWEAFYASSHDAGVTLEYVEIRYAGDTNFTFGGGDTSALQLNKDATTLNNVIVRDVKSNGIYIVGHSPQLTDVSVFRAGGVAFFAEIAATPVYTNISAAFTGGDHVQVRNGTIQDAQRLWDFGGLPVHLAGDVTVAATSTLVIVPGQVVKLPPSGHIHVVGLLRAVGTPTAPITFTSTRDDTVAGDSNSDGDATTPGPGAWEALYLDGLDSELAHVAIRYAGDLNSTFGGGQIPSLHIRTTDNVVSLVDVSVSFGASTGMIINQGRPRLENVHLKQNAGEAIFLELTADPQLINLTAIGNGADRIGVRTGTISPGRPSF